MGTGPTGSSLLQSFELLSAKAVTLSDSGRWLADTTATANVYLNLQQPKSSEGMSCLCINIARGEVVMVHNWKGSGQGRLCRCVSCLSNPNLEFIARLCSWIQSMVSFTESDGILVIKNRYDPWGHICLDRIKSCQRNCNLDFYLDAAGLLFMCFCPLGLIKTHFKKPQLSWLQELETV